MRSLAFALCAVAMATTGFVACAAEDESGGPHLVHGSSSSKTRDAGEESNTTPEPSPSPSSSSSSSSTPTTPSDASADAAKPPPAEPDMSGDGTYYNFTSGGACGLPTPADKIVAAINAAQYSNENCGRCAEVKGPNGTAVVKIVDKCGGCSSGDLDLSVEAFEEIAAKSAGRVKITWHFVDCPK